MLRLSVSRLWVFLSSLLPLTCLSSLGFPARLRCVPHFKVWPVTPIARDWEWRLCLSGPCIHSLLLIQSHYPRFIWTWKMGFLTFSPWKFLKQNVFFPQKQALWMASLGHYPKLRLFLVLAQKWSWVDSKSPEIVSGVSYVLACIQSSGRGGPKFTKSTNFLNLHQAL